MNPKYYAAVALKTESGDLYCFLIEYEVPTEIPVEVYRLIGWEMEHVYEVQVDAQGFADKHIESLIMEAVDAVK